MERDAYAQAMREGHAHAWAGRWREAAASYRRASAALPNDSTARASLAASLAHGGAPGDALDIYVQLAEERPDDSALVLRIAELQHRMGRVDEADGAYLRVAELYREAGQVDKARSVYERLLSLSGHRADTMRLMLTATRAGGYDDIAGRAEAKLTAAAAAADERRHRSRNDPEAAAGELEHDVSALATALRSAGHAVPRWEYQGGRGMVGAPLVSADDALSRLSAAPFDLDSSRLVGLVLAHWGRRSEARQQLGLVVDVAELRGDLALATDVVQDLLPLVEDRRRLHRRVIRLALLAEQTEVAAAAHLALAELAASEDRETALAEIRRARAVAPLSASVQGAAAEHLAKLGAAEEAHDARRRAFQLAPRDLGHAVAYAVSSATRGAIDEMTLALDAVGNRAPMVGVDGGAGGADQFEQAAIDNAVRRELVGSAPAVAWCRGRLRELLGDLDGREDLRVAARGESPLGPMAAVYLGERYLAEDEVEAARDLAVAWLSWAMREHDAEPELARRVAGLALSAAERGQADRGDMAVAALRVLRSIDPDDRVVAALLAERLAVTGRRTEAARELAELAARERAAGRAAEAAALYAAAHDLSPEATEAGWTAAELAAERGDREEARRRYLAVASTDPGRAVAALMAAAELSSWGARAELLRRAIALAPAEIEPRRRLVAALVAMGQASLAATEAAALAELLYAAGDRAGAIAAVEQAQRLDPWNSGLAALHVALEAEGGGPR